MDMDKKVMRCPAVEGRRFDNSKNNPRVFNTRLSKLPFPLGKAQRLFGSSHASPRHFCRSIGHRPAVSLTCGAYSYDARKAMKVSKSRTKSIEGSHRIQVEHKATEKTEKIPAGRRWPPRSRAE